MQYDILMDNRERFNQEWMKTRSYLNTESGFSYRYSPQNEKRYTMNAAVDDLRIIRSLYEAGIAFDDPALTREANQYGKRFAKYNIRGNHLYDFYDETYKETNDFITLCYIDLKTINMLSVPINERAALNKNLLSILEEGYLSDDFPFYMTRFDYSTGQYVAESIHTIESLLTILHLAEVNQQEQSSITFIKNKVAEGSLFGQYTIDGEPLNEIQSTAIYALTAIIGSQIGDISLYEESISQMEKYQVHEEKSILYGAFGDPQSLKAYSFDNLMALLAFAY